MESKFFCLQVQFYVTTFTPGLCNGNYQLVFALDPAGVIGEVNETNNVVTFPIALTQQVSHDKLFIYLLE